MHESDKVMVPGSEIDPLVNLSVLSVPRKYFILVGGLQLPEDVWRSQRYLRVSSAKRLLVHLLLHLLTLAAV